MKINLDNLGLELKKRRGDRGIRAVAKEIGISFATLSRIELGKQPDLDTFTKICNWLKINPGDVLGYGGLDPANQTQTTECDPKVYVQYKAERTMSSETAKKLSELIMHVQQSIQNDALNE